MKKLILFLLFVSITTNNLFAGETRRRRRWVTEEELRAVKSKIENKSDKSVSSPSSSSSSFNWSAAPTPTPLLTPTVTKAPSASTSSTALSQISSSLPRSSSSSSSSTQYPSASSSVPLTILSSLSAPTEPSGFPSALSIPSSSSSSTMPPLTKLTSPSISSQALGEEKLTKFQKGYAATVRNIPEIASFPPGLHPLIAQYIPKFPQEQIDDQTRKLHHALQTSVFTIELLEHAIRNGADVNAKLKLLVSCKEGWCPYVTTPLLRAMRFTNPNIFKLILDANPDLEERGEFPFVRCGEVPCFSKEDPISKKRVLTLVTPLITAVGLEESNYVKMLLDKGAIVDSTDSEGKTALTHFFELTTLNPNIFNMLVKAGADIEKTDNAGRTQLLRAALNHNFEVFKKLLELGANINARNKNGSNAIILSTAEALQSGGAEKIINIINLSLTKGADINAINNFGYTALTLAIMNFLEGQETDSAEVINYLLDHGANNIGEIQNMKDLFIKGKISIESIEKLQNIFKKHWENLNKINPEAAADPKFAGFAKKLKEISELAGFSSSSE